MTPDIVQLLPQLGLSGVSLFIMWKMVESVNKRMKEKDQELITEIDKRDKRNDESQKVFQEFAAKTHDSMVKQLSDNTKALTTFSASVQENIKVLNKVNEHLNSPHNPVFIQNNAGEKTT